MMLCGSEEQHSKMNRGTENGDSWQAREIEVKASKITIMLAADRICRP